MPKRVEGMCPDCHSLVSKRYGRLRTHFPKNADGPKRNFFRPAETLPRPDLCSGSRKRVLTWSSNADK